MLRCCQSVSRTWRSAAALDRRPQRSDVVGIVEVDLDRARLVVEVEIGLRLGERHEDEGRIVFRHADLEDRHHRIGLDPRRHAERRDVAARRDQREAVADGEAEGGGKPRADGDAAGLRETRRACRASRCWRRRGSWAGPGRGCRGRGRRSRSLLPLASAWPSTSGTAETTPSHRGDAIGDARRSR